MDKLPGNVNIEELHDRSKKRVGYRAKIQVTMNDSITSPIFQNKNDALKWANEKYSTTKID